MNVVYRIAVKLASTGPNAVSITSIQASNTRVLSSVVLTGPTGPMGPQGPVGPSASTLTSSATRTSSFTASPNTYYPVDATSGNITVTLPTSVSGQELAIKKTDATTNLVTISGTINGATSSLPLRLQNQGKVLIPDGNGGWNIYAGDINLAALDARYNPLITAGTTSQYYRGDKTFQTLDKTAVGLANVDNTSDANKNVLSASKLTTARNINGVAFDGTSDISISTSVSDASTTAKGVVQLAGDLGGTASSPTTPTAVHITGTETIAGAKTFSSAAIFSSGATLNATSIVTDTTTGLKIGTATTQKLGFFNATPVVQQGATTDIGTVLSNLGLRVAGGAYSFATSGVAQTLGVVRSNATTITAATTLNITTSTEYQFANAATAAFTVTLPTIAASGYRFVIKKTDSSANAVTIKAGTAGTIDASNTYLLSTQYKAVTVVSTATADVWLVMGVV